MNGSAKELLDSDIVELLRIGPTGGIDTGTAPRYVAPQNLVASQNFSLASLFGALNMTLGRTPALASPLPGTITGIFCMNIPDAAAIYLFAVSNPVTGVGELWSAPLGGTPTQLTAPALTPNLQTYFCTLGQWVFLTNGVDTPLKITQALLVTQWGIVAPVTAPLPSSAEGGNLTQGGTYTYCVTFANATQESSQGTISETTTLTNVISESSASTTLANDGTAGDSFQFTVTSGSFTLIQGTIVLAANTPVASIAGLLAQAINAAPPLRGSSNTINAVATGTTIAMTDSTGGDPTFTFTPSGSTTFTPATGTFSGGTSTINDAISLTQIPVSSDPQVTERNIYRIGGALGQWRLVATIPDNTTTTYMDTLADSAVTGQSLTVYRDPPPAFGYITVHQNRVWGFIGGGALWFSNYNEPWGFNSNTGILQCNSTTMDDDAVALASLGAVLVCFKKRNTYLVYGSTDLSFQTYFAFGLGCTSARSVAAAFGWVWWESRQGIFYYNGGGFDPVANNISSGKFQQSNIKAFLDGLGVADRAVSCGFVWDSTVHMSFPTQNVTWFFDLRSQQWGSLGFFTPVAWFDAEDQIDVVAANGATVGDVDEWFQTPTDLGEPIVATIASRRDNFGDADSVKVASFVSVEGPITPGATASVTLTLNPGPTQTVLAPLVFDLAEGAPVHIQDVPLNEFFTLQVDVSLESSVQTYLTSVSVHGWVVRKLPATAIDGAAPP